MIDEEKVFKEAEEHEERLTREAQFRMLKAGVRGTADLLSDPSRQEDIARGALGAAILGNRPQEGKQPGPARRKPPKVSARKRQRQARKTQRGRR